MSNYWRQRRRKLERRSGAMSESERFCLGAHLQNAATALRLPFWGNAVWPLDSIWLLLFDEDSNGRGH